MRGAKGTEGKGDETMTATKELKAMATLMTRIAEAVEEATKAGMSNQLIAEILEMAKNTVEGADE
jgi:DNA-binding NarL/FixJ family response regulator